MNQAPNRLYAGAAADTDRFVVDAHQHFWNKARAPYPWLGPDTPAIDRAIEFDELEPILRRHGIDGTVLVQSADNDADTDYMLSVAAEHPQILAVVGYVPLERPLDAEARLLTLTQTGIVVGVRNLIHNQPDPDWLLRGDVDRGLHVLDEAGVTFDVVSVLPRHLEHVPVIAERHPNLRVVIDHLSKPPVKSDEWQPWRRLITRAADCPNVYAKVSGLYPVTGGPADWNAADIEPFVHFALEIFGPDRLMYGGDWPISILNGGYDRVWQELSKVFDALSAPERSALLGRTAIEFYRIPADRLAAVAT